MLDVKNASSTDLEELLEAKIPCGGTRWPHNRPCPWGNEAVWVSWHVVRCGSTKAFKCEACYQEWLAAAMAKTSTGRARCVICGFKQFVWESYERL